MPGSNIHDREMYCYIWGYINSRSGVVGLKVIVCLLNDTIFLNSYKTSLLSYTAAIWIIII